MSTQIEAQTIGGNLNLPQVPGTEPSRAILDAFRIAIALQIHRALPNLSVEQVYPGVLYGVKGVDFTVALARFRLGGKPDDWAKKVVDAVSTTPVLRFENNRTTCPVPTRRIHRISHAVERIC